MEDDGVLFNQVDTGVWVVLGTVMATLLLRTDGNSLPTWLDFVVALFFGGLALALVKLASHAVRDYLLDILANSGEASTEHRAATQTTMATKRGDGNSGAGVKTGPPKEFMSGNFLVFGKKQVRLDEKEQGDLFRAIAQAQRKRANSATFVHGGLVSKLYGIGLVSEGGKWSADGLRLFNIEVDHHGDQLDLHAENNLV